MLPEGKPMDLVPPVAVDTELAETIHSIYTKKHTAIFTCHSFGAKFYAIAKTCLSIVLNQGLLWQTGAKKVYHREQSLKIYLSVTRISLKIYWSCWKRGLITYLSWSMLYITQEFLNSWQERGETFTMDIKFISQNVVSTTWQPSANLAGIPQVHLAIFTKVQEKVNSYPYGT